MHTQFVLLYAPRLALIPSSADVLVDIKKEQPARSDCVLVHSPRKKGKKKEVWGSELEGTLRSASQYVRSPCSCVHPTSPAAQVCRGVTFVLPMLAALLSRPLSWASLVLAMDVNHEREHHLDILELIVGLVATSPTIVLG